MIYTNKLNLPEVFLNVLQNNDYSRGDADISVSSLLLPPRIFQLTERHKDEIVSDIIDNIWRIFGTAIHNLLEKNAPKNTLTEERLNVKIGGWIVSGRFDLYDGGLDDYKVTSGWSIVFGSRIEEWKWLLNFYRLLALDAHLEVNRLRNILIIRDWSAYQAKQNPDFPQAQVHIINQPVEEYDKTLERIYTRVKIHKDASKLSDADLPICTPEERWASKDVWAVMKEGRKSALKLFNSLEELHKQFGKEGPFHIEKRLGESKRCEKYCDANQFCTYYKEVLCQK